MEEVVVFYAEWELCVSDTYLEHENSRKYSRVSRLRVENERDRSGID